MSLIKYFLEDAPRLRPDIITRLFLFEQRKLPKMPMLHDVPPTVVDELFASGLTVNQIRTLPPLELLEKLPPVLNRAEARSMVMYCGLLNSDAILRVFKVLGCG